jgi:hypothetical protein
MASNKGLSSPKSEDKDKILVILSSSNGSDATDPPGM